MISSSKIHKQKHTRQSFCEHRAIPLASMDISAVDQAFEADYKQDVATSAKVPVTLVNVTFSAGSVEVRNSFRPFSPTQPSSFLSLGPRVG